MPANSTVSKKRKKGRYVVATATELPPGKRKIVTVGGGEIGIFNIAGKLHALRNICPHKGGPLCSGRLRPHVVSPSVYQIDYEQDKQVLKCPWHQWEFDIQTGRALYDASLRVKIYVVRREGEEIVLYLDDFS